MIWKKPFHTSEVRRHAQSVSDTSPDAICSGMESYDKSD